MGLFFPPVPPFIPGYRLIDGDQLNKLATHIAPTLIYASRYTSLSEADQTAAASPYGVLVIDLPVVLTADTTLTASYVMFTGAGQIVRRAFGLTVEGELIADEKAQIFDAGGTGPVVLQQNTEVSVYWLGATGLGLADDTYPILQAIRTLKASQGYRSGQAGVIARATLLSRYGVFLVTSQITLNMTYVTWDATGSTIDFEPTSSSVCIAVDNGAAQSLYVQLRHFIIYSRELTLRKIGIQLNDASNCLVEDVFIWGAGSGLYWSGGAAGSVGIQTKGRELCAFDKIEIYADTPINLANNPNTVPNDLEDVDHFVFRDLYMIGSGSGTLPWLVYLNDGLGASNLEFEGHQAWVGGKGGFHMNDTRGGGSIASRCIKFANVRGEQGMDAAQYYFDISAPTQQIDNVEFNNVLCDSSCNSFKISGIIHTVFDGVVTATAHTALNATAVGIKDTIDMRGCLWDPNGAVVLTGFVPSWVGAWDHIDYSRLPSTATYVVAPSGGPHLDIRYSCQEQNDVRRLAWVAHLASGASQLLCAAFTTSQAATAAIIRAVGSGGAILEGGQILYGAPGLVLLSNTANFDAANTAGKLSIYLSGADLFVKNNTAGTLSIVISMDVTVI